MAARVVVLHYDEIALKGGNRPWFESRLRENLDRAMEGTRAGRVRKERGRMILPVAADASDEDRADILARIGRVPGVAWYSEATESPRDIEALTTEVVSRARGATGTFRVETRRADKRYPMTSVDVNRAVGAAVVVATGRTVRLKDPDDTYGIEIGNNTAFIYSVRLPGLGGLPVGTAGRVVALLSGGIDSPVAAFRMMRRGCRVDGVHFLNAGLDPEGVLDKLDLIGNALCRFQGTFRLHVVPFDDLQRAIIAAVPSDHRMLVYRRTMLRLANRIRADRRALALVTGDSVGQVASQTLENIGVVYAAVTGPVLPPLCGMEKAEIIAEARRIGTYEASILPHQDCCSFMVSPHPETRARLPRVVEMEAAVAWGTLDREALQRSEVRSYPR
jgi:thiamine biosynthesis protein ThiI